MKKLAVLMFSAIVLGVAVAQTVVPAPRPSADLLREAQVKAAAEHKSVFVRFHASWCGWCKVMSKVTDNPKFKQVFDKYFVTVELDVLEAEKDKALENPGSLDVMKSLNADKEGIPFYYITDSKGKSLIDSRIKGAGSNIGCPVKPEEIAHFMKMMKTGAPKMTAADATFIQTTFEENAKTINH